MSVLSSLPRRRCGRGVRAGDFTTVDGFRLVTSVSYVWVTTGRGAKKRTRLGEVKLHRAVGDPYVMAPGAEVTVYREDWSA